MAVNDFWGALANDPALVSASNPYISPELLKSSLLDLVGVGMAVAQVRTQFGLTVGTARGDEFGDLIATAQALPGTGATKRQLQAYVIDKLASAAKMGVRQGELSPNPYRTGNALRLQARAILVQELGGTAGLVGTLVSAT